MKLSKIKRDVNAVDSGVWVNKVIDDLDIKVASTDSRKYTDALRVSLKPYQRTLKNMSNDQFIEIQNKVAAKHLLLDWHNMTDENDQPIPYSSEKALELLNDPEMADFRELIMSLASEQELFRKEALQELATKSE